jgi:tryptophan halogenase
MKIVIVGGGTAGWATALMAAKRHPNHEITVIESSKIGVIGVGESTTGRMTDVLNNFRYDYGCDHNEFIAETGATLKYGIQHKGWTKNIDDYYIGPIDGSWTSDKRPDVLFAYGLNKLTDKELIKVSLCGYWTYHGYSNFNKENKDFVSLGDASGFTSSYRHAMHVDAHLVGQYFKKVCLRNDNAKHIDTEVVDVVLNSTNGFIKALVLSSGEIIEGDFFIDCTGFKKLLINKLGAKWVSYQKYLPVNTGLPFQLKYQENEMPKPYTTAWAQKFGWMWQIPLMDRIGCGYVFSDAFTTVDQAHKEIEQKLGREIEPIKVIKFNTGRQEESWIKNCLAIGLSSAFLEPLEATSIHTTIVQADRFVMEFLKNTLEDTVNEGSINLFNNRTAQIFDDTRDFIVLHYMGDRDDSEFWRFIGTGVTQTDFVKNILSMSKSRLPTANDFPSYAGSAGWPLYSYVLAGIKKLDKEKVINELNFEVHSNQIKNLTVEAFHDLQYKWHKDMKNNMTYDEFINYFRELRRVNGISN